MREARQLAAAVNARRLVSVRRRGNLSATFMAMTESASTIPVSAHLPSLLLPNVHSIRKTTFPSIDPTSAHLAYLILSLLLADMLSSLISSQATLAGEYPNGSNNCCKQNRVVMMAYQYFHSCMPAQRPALMASSSNALLVHSLAL